jgi:hypothetical protein
MNDYDDDMDSIYEALETIRDALHIVAGELKIIPRGFLERKLKKLDRILEIEK